MAGAGTTTLTRTCQICVSFLHFIFLVVVMEATTTKIPMVLHTTTVEVDMLNTLLPVAKPPRSRHSEWYAV